MPASMRLDAALPTTTCTPGSTCGCGITVTVDDSACENIRQPHPWQSNAWALDYNRRTLIEGLNGQIRYQKLKIDRGFIRMRGLAATAWLLATQLAGYNAVHLHAWHTSRHRPDPWQQHLREVADNRPLDRYTRTRGRRAPPVVDDADTKTKEH
ncbi:hypothetical protein [Isoptericola rhizosphaerae]|uniref:hypothetical protein n=1 Tax=Isoptericola rhizosphaerae TaxID=3377837 RepID=UPI00383A4BEF